MNSIELKIEEFWIRDYKHDPYIYRDSTYEVDVFPEWAKPRSPTTPKE